jgi:hypothetical protein
MWDRHDQIALWVSPQQEHVVANDRKPEPPVESDCLQISFPYSKPEAPAPGPGGSGVNGAHQFAGHTTAVPLSYNVYSMQLGRPISIDAGNCVCRPKLGKPHEFVGDLGQQGNHPGIGYFLALYLSAEFLCAVQVDVLRQIVGGKSLAKCLLREFRQSCGVGPSGCSDRHHCEVPDLLFNV